MLKQSSSQPLANLGNGDTPLLAACRKGNLKIASLLLRHSRNLAMISESQNHLSPLHIACSRGDHRLVNIILDALSRLFRDGQRQPNINFLDKLGRTPLFNACYHGRVQVVHQLLEFNKTFPGSVNLNCQVEGTGRTPLHGAVARESREIVELLLNEGHVTIGVEANPSSRTRQLLRKELERKRAQTVVPSLVHSTKLNECEGMSWDPSCFPSSFSPSSILGTQSSQSSEMSDDIDVEIGVFGSPVQSLSPTSPSPEYIRSPTPTSPSQVHPTAGSPTSPLSTSFDSHTRSRVPPRTIIPRSATLADPVRRPGMHPRTVSPTAKTTDVFQTPDGLLTIQDTPSDGYKKFGEILITPLAEACVYKNIGIVGLLLQFGAVDKRGIACQIALLLKKEPIVHMILAHECYPNSDVDPNEMMQGFPGSVLSWEQKNLQKINGTWLDETAPFFMRPVSCDDDAPPCRAMQFRRITHQMITHVQLGGNCLSSVPVELFCLPGVVKIDLSNNSLEEIPDSSMTQPQWRCSRLENLNISSNSLSVLPTSVWYLESLRKLRAERNQLKSLYSGEVLSQADSLCPSLEELFLHHNKLKSLPEFLFELPSLIKASFSENKLVSVPEHIWFNPTVQEIDLSHNQLTCLPFAELDELKDTSRADSVTSSTVFSLATPAVGNQVMIHPMMLRQRSLYSARRGSLNQTQSQKEGFKIRQVEEHLESAETIELEFCDYTMLTKLNLSYNKLSFFPTTLPCLAPNLSELDISNNPVKVIDIQFLPQGLKKLMAKKCQIEHFGATLTQQQSDLVKKRCYHDTLAQACLHRRHDSLQFLATLHLNDNKLTNLLLLKHPHPKTLDWNAGIEVEREYCPSNSTFDLLYPALEGLDLSGNKLEGCFNPNIGRQNQLKWIRLINNPSLERLPKEFSHLKKSNQLTMLEICVGLPKLVQPPPEYQTKETTVNQLLTYLKSLLKK